MKILIATDGSECADKAQSDLTRAGLPEDVEARVLSVADVWLSSGDSDVGLPEEWSDVAKRARSRAEAALSHASAIAETAAEKLRARFPQWKIEAQSSADSPGWGIIKIAEQWRADLAVVGSHGYSVIDKLILGSVSQKVLSHAHCAVRVGRSTTTARKEVRIIIGMDGSEGAKLAVDHVAARNWPDGSEVRLVAVLDPRLSTAALSYLPTAAHWIQQSFRDEDAWIRSVVEQEIQKLKKAGVQVTSQILAGDPKHILIDHSKEWEADCIFVGARGLTRVERFLMGSVSVAVASRAGCSVEVVRK